MVSEKLPMDIEIVKKNNQILIYGERNIVYPSYYLGHYHSKP